MANRSPPTPLPVGSMSPMVAFAAMAASTAVPPRLRTSSATWLTSGWLVAAMPCVAMTSERVATSEPLGRGPAYDPSIAMARTTASTASSRFRRAGHAGFEHLPDFTIGDALLVLALGVVSHDAAPERHRHGVAQVLGDFPAAGETIEDELDRELADPASAMASAHEELRHAEVDRWPAWHRAARHHGESHRLAAAQDDEWIDRRIAEPARQLVGFAVTDLAERSRAEHAGVQRRKIIEVVAVDAFDPLAIAGSAARIPDTDRHGPPRKTKPGQTLLRSARAV